MSYDAQMATAQRLIAAKGVVRTLRHFPTGAPLRDRITGAVTNDEGADIDVTMVVLPVKVSTRGTSGDSNASVVKKSRKFLIAGATCPVLPQNPDLILGVEGQNWIVSSAQPLAPDDGASIIYTGYMEI